MDTHPTPTPQSTEDTKALSNAAPFPFSFSHPDLGPIPPDGDFPLWGCAGSLGAAARADKHPKALESGSAVGGEKPQTGKTPKQVWGKENNWGLLGKPTPAGFVQLERKGGGKKAVGGWMGWNPTNHSHAQNQEQKSPISLLWKGPKRPRSEPFGKAIPTLFLWLFLLFHKVKPPKPPTTKKAKPSKQKSAPPNDRPKNPKLGKIWGETAAV